VKTMVCLLPTQQTWWRFNNIDSRQPLSYYVSG